MVTRAEDELGEAVRTTEEMAERVVTDTTKAIDAATVAADPARTPTGDAYEDLTKAELYRRATANEIAGRSSMSKSELIAALIAAEATTGSDDA